MDTRVAEFGIACEACHGPGEEHARANRQPLRRYALHVTNGVDDTIVNPARLSAKRSAQVCGQCHGFWRDNAAGKNEQFLVDGDPFRPGDDLNAYATLERYDDAAQDETPHKMPHLGDYQEIDVNFWSDGMVRAGGREYNELVNAACHLRGELTCLSCHRMHQSTNDPRPLDQWKDDQMKLGHKGDLACTQCHVEFEDAQSVASHTHHDRNSGGSRCLNCHMPYTTYALLKAIRSHQISVPNVQSSLATGRPNACNQCHLDQTMAWTAEHLTAWYGTPEADIPKDERDEAASVVWLLKGDAGQRALMAWSLGWDEAQEASGTHWMPRYLAELIEDPYDAVRLIAFRALQQFPGFEDLKFDFDQSDQETAAIRVDVIRRWSQQNSSPSRQGAARLLLDPDGRVMHKELQRLLEQRDLRPIRLPE